MLYLLEKDLSYLDMKKQRKQIEFPLQKALDFSVALCYDDATKRAKDNGHDV